MLSTIHLTMVVWLWFTVAVTPNTPQDKSTSPDQNPCARANTQLEINECSADQYRKADARLNSLYAKIAADLQKDQDKTALDKLRATERAWIQYRDLHCDAARNQFAGGSISPTIWAGCMKMVTEHRIEELQAAYLVDGQPRK
ncbi:MAG TPA: lysozyme inhibitor LprI family protein [Candidatus Angelobacter sp.]|nr:lysozyme inhibitor LprI family protein [Candidatus Angelobacter sp.]